MNQIRRINKKRLLATVIICLFSVVCIGIGKIFINQLNIKNNIEAEQDFLFTIRQHIESELPTTQYHEWSEIANNHSIVFLKLNSLNDNNKLDQKYISLQNNSLFTASVSTFLANLIFTVKAHYRENLSNK